MQYNSKDLILPQNCVFLSTNDGILSFINSNNYSFHY